MKAGNPRIVFLIGRFRNLEFQRSIMIAADRIALIAEFMEIAVVDPDILSELELADQAGADHERRDAPFLAVVRRFLGKVRSVSRPAADHAATIHVGGGVARIHPAHVRAERHGITVGVHVLIIEIVVALHVGAKLRVVLVRRKRQRRAAAPTAHQFCRDQFLLFRRSPLATAESHESGRHVPEAADTPCSCHCVTGFPVAAG